jgi:hypothetical protein
MERACKRGYNERFRLKKGPDFYRASDAEKLLFLAGIPKRYWHASFDDLQPTAIPTDDGMISVKKQMEWLERLKHPWELSGAVIGIGGKPTDAVALSAGFAVIKAMVKYTSDLNDVLVVDPANTYYKEALDPKLVLINNVLTSGTFQRRQEVRDWIGCYPATPRIVIVAGDDPVEYFHKKLHAELHMALFFEGKLVKRRNI